MSPPIPPHTVRMSEGEWGRQPRPGTFIPHAQSSHSGLWDVSYPKKLNPVRDFLPLMECTRIDLTPVTPLRYNEHLYTYSE